MKKKHTVLIVDDEYIIRERLRMHLENAGYIVIGEAEDGAEAEKIISSLSPEIVITDIEMPFESGIELLESTRKNNSKIKFIILTGFSEFEYAVSAVKNKASEYLLKPIESKKLLKAMENVCKEIEENEKSNLLLEENRRMKTSENLLLFLTGKKEKQTLPLNVQKIIEKPQGKRMLLIYGVAGEKMQKNNTYFLGNGLAFKMIQKGAYDIDNDLINSDCYIAIGLPCYSANDIKKSYSSLRILLLSRYITPQRKVYKIDKEIEPDVHKINSIILQNENLIEQGKISTLLKVLEIELRELTNPQELELFLFLFLVSLRKFKQSDEDYPFHNHSAIWLLERFSNYSDLVNFLDELIRRKLNLTDFTSKIDLVDRVKTFLEENYALPHLNMEIISLHTFAHPNYISSKFKEETGLSVTEYLSNLRLERAYSLLQNTDSSCKKISIMVGFNDQYYFSKCFKKKFGYPPNSIKKE